MTSRASWVGPRASSPACTELQAWRGPALHGGLDPGGGVGSYGKQAPGQAGGIPALGPPHDGRVAVPADTFASKVAALQDQCADASIGNVTGSNAVNVFLGLGVAWSVAAVYWAVQGRPFEVRTGTLAFSVTLFTVFAFVGIAVLLYRRRPHIGGELGGPRGPKLATTALFLGLWFLYILFASLEAYCHIRGF